MRCISVLLAACVGLSACSGPAPSDNASFEDVEAASARAVGAVVHQGGVLFRVWAPGSTSAFVAGDFSDWSKLSMTREADDYFMLDVAAARPGQKYKFVLRGSDNRDTWRADPRAQQMVNSSGDSIIHDPSAYAWSSPPFPAIAPEEQVIYELHIGTFNDAAGGKPGTYASAIAKLDHLRDLGINMIELLPIAEFPGDYSWGYNPAFLYAPESSYGTPDDLKHLIDEAHARGIGVIFDVVHNHYGNDFPRWCHLTNCAASGSAYFYSDDRRRTPWGATRPDFSNKQVRSFVRDNARMLLGEYRASGLRWDATKFIRTVDGTTSTELPDAVAFLRDANSIIDTEAPDALMIAEDLGGGDFITGRASDGGLGFDTQWTSAFANIMRATLAPGADTNRDLDAVASMLAQRYNGSATQRVIYSESHDEVSEGKNRFTEAIEGEATDSVVTRKKTTLAASLLFTTPGIPMIFQGQELLEDGHFTDTDPIDWTKADRFAGIVSMYRDLISLRKNMRGLSGNNIDVFHLNRSAKVLAYRRWNGADDVIVVANFSAREFSSYVIGLPRAGTWKVRFNGDARRYASDFSNAPAHDIAAAAPARDGLPFRGSVAIGPYSAVILSLDP